MVKMAQILPTAELHYLEFFGRERGGCRRRYSGDMPGILWRDFCRAGGFCLMVLSQNNYTAARKAELRFCLTVWRRSVKLLRWKKRWILLHRISRKCILRTAFFHRFLSSGIKFLYQKYAHPFFKKVITSSKKYHAHDENNKFKIGDEVKIIESKPFSKKKRREVINKWYKYKQN